MEHFEHIPALFTLNGRKVLVVGGGVTAYRSARLLTEAGACVTIVAPQLSEEMAPLTDEGRAHHLAKAFSTEDLAGQALVVAATGVDAVDAEVSAAAQARELPVNVIDAPKLSSFIIPTVEAMAGLRHVDPRRFWEWFFARPIASAVFSSNERLARERMPDALNHEQRDQAVPDAGTNHVSKGRSTAKCTKEHNTAGRATGPKPQDGCVKLFEVRIPSINALFIAREVGGALKLTSKEDIPCLDVEAGQTIAAQDVIRRMELLARKAASI